MEFINTYGMKKRNNPEYMQALLHNTEYANSEEYKSKLTVTEKAASIRESLINSQGKENRQKMRRKYSDIIMLDDEELINKHKECI